MINNKKAKIAIIIFIIIVLNMAFLCINLTKAKASNVIASGLIKGDQSKAAKNTEYLQKLIDDVSADGGGRITIPNGTYYFDADNYKNRYNNSNEYYAIECKDNVEICGESEENTILCPVGEYPGGIDMFFCKTFSAEKHLTNADFRNFTIDEDEVTYSGNYDSSGKGFMFILYEDCDWENVTVKNTRGTGFGMDCPINCTIKNCKAIHCGTGVTSAASGGGSGFGIGTGYSDNESIIIENCYAENNGIFGYFFEHQSRFQGKENNIYKATRSDKFVVRNCIANNNLFNFGGLRAFDLTYENCTSLAPKQEEFYFSQNCRRIHLTNNSISRTYNDVPTSSSAYYNAINWAQQKGMILGASNENFNINQKLTRLQAVWFFYLLSEYPGDVLLGRNTYIYSDKEVNTGFIDIDQTFNDKNDDDANYLAWAAAAINWAKNEGITNGTNAEQTMFSPNVSCTKGSFITFLYRYAGEPQTSGTSPFSDVQDSSQFYYNAVVWAYNNGIIEKDSTNLFNPNDYIDRGSAILMLHRYATSNIEFNITYNLNGGTASNPSTYKAGTSSFSLKSPTKSGSVFAGWTGSNGNTPQKSVSVSRSSRGNLVYTANWIAQYTITFDGNGGNVSLKTKTVNEGDEIKSFPTATRSGYRLIGWYAHPKDDVVGQNGNVLDSKYSTNYKVYNNITLYAHWEKLNLVPYTVIHQQMQLDGQTYKTVETESLAGEAGQRVTPLVKEYKGFKSPDAQTVTIADNGSTTVTYLYTRNKYKFTLGNCEGVSTTGSTQTGDYYYEENINLKANVELGYTWSKWSNNDTKQETTFTMPDGDITVSPEATKDVYNITYDTKGGTITGQKQTYTVTDETFTLVIPTREGYVFTGWTGSNGNEPQILVTIEKGSTGDKNYTANWVEKETIATYRVIHQQMQLDGQTYKTVETENLVGAIGQSVTPLVKEYKGFKSPDAQTVTIAEDGSTTVTYLYARNKYKFTLGSCEGVSTTESTQTGDYYYEENINLKANVDLGYTWSKWSNNDTKQETTFTMPAEDITVSPEATKDVYNITYDTKGGTITGQKQTYTVTDESFTLVRPTKEGYTFTGWTGSNGNEPQILVTIKKGSTGDKNYTANWEKDTIVEKKTRVVIKYRDVNTEEQIHEDVVLTLEEGEVLDYSNYLYTIDQYEYVKSEKNNDSTEIIVYYVKKIKLTVNFIDKDSNTKIRDSIVIEGTEGEKFDISNIITELKDYKLIDNENNVKGQLSRNQLEINLYFQKNQDKDQNIDKDQDQNQNQNQNKDEDKNTATKPDVKESQEDVDEKKYSTASKSTLPYAGEKVKILIIIFILTVFSIIGYVGYKKLDRYIK